MLNKIIVQGRCCRDVELRRTANGTAVASVSIACERDIPNRKTGERETDFLDIVGLDKTGEFLAKWFTKGSMIFVSGRLQIRNWTDKEGNKRRNAEVVADNVYFGDSKKDSGSAPSEKYVGFVKSDGFAGGEPEYKQGNFGQVDIPDAQLPF